MLSRLANEHDFSADTEMFFTPDWSAAVERHRVDIGTQQHTATVIPGATFDQIT